MEVAKEIQQGTSSFYIGEDETNPTAEIHYAESEDGNLIVDHTFVSEEFRGQGVGEKLVKEVVQYARDKQKKIIPECTYAQKQFERNQEYQDVLLKN
jgi:uncharacterized protein